MSNEVLYGTIDLISINQIVARTKIRLNLREITDYDQEIELFINEAAASLGSKPTFRKKNCKVAICDGKALLPRGLKKLLGVLPVCHNPLTVVKEELRNSIFVNGGFYAPLLYLERTFMDECLPEAKNIQNCPQIQPIQGCVEQVGNHLVFPIPCFFTHVIISYDGYAIDKESCILEMHPAYERGFSEYARWMMLDTYNFLWTGEPRLLPGTIQTSKEIWGKQYEMLVSNAFADDWEQNHYMIKRVLHGLLQDQNRVVLNG